MDLRVSELVPPALWCILFSKTSWLGCETDNSSDILLAFLKLFGLSPEW